MWILWFNTWLGFAFSILYNDGLKSTKHLLGWRWEQTVVCSLLGSWRRFLPQRQVRWRVDSERSQSQESGSYDCSDRTALLHTQACTYTQTHYTVHLSKTKNIKCTTHTDIHINICTYIHKCSGQVQCMNDSIRVAFIKLSFISLSLSL